jgi:uncharacterized membrane protein YhhN
LYSSSTEKLRPAIRALYGLVAALLLLGLARGQPDERRRNRIPRPLRMLSSALVLLGALLSWQGSRGRSRLAARLAAGGMACGFLGDLIMAKIIPLPGSIVFGMLSFGMGHILYMRSLLQRGAGRSQLFKALGIAWAVSLAGWMALVRGSPAAKALKGGALAYALLLGSMSGMAAALATHDRRYTPAALGGALFFASDAILASELFRAAHFPGIGDVVWITYIAGQGLIVGTSDSDTEDA